MDLVSAFALAVNEENAAGGRVVTAPTNGAAGIIPAVLHYYIRYCDSERDPNDQDVEHQPSCSRPRHRHACTQERVDLRRRGRLPGGGRRGLLDGRRGIDGAALGGTNAQIENAAEIGMEHNLGLTCDPDRRARAGAVHRAERHGRGEGHQRRAPRDDGDGSHKVSLDAVIATMRQTGHDLQSKYKETSLGGLAATVVYC
jgi:L-serine dehydratase